MTDEHIEIILNDFRDWLREHGDEPIEADVTLNLVNEFTALRHEVKLLTKATRGQSEQMTAALESLAERELDTADEDTDTDDELRPVLTTILDITDTLERAVSAVQRFAEESAPKRSLIQRLFGGPPSSETKDKLAALADGLELSQQRLLAALQRLDFEAVDAVGESFDPETMEALEAVADDEQASGTVLEEVRAGYCWRGQVFRYAQVKVAK